jgi:hypothetical protein
MVDLLTVDLGGKGAVTKVGEKRIDNFLKNLTSQGTCHKILLEACLRSLTEHKGSTQALLLR